MKWLPLVYFLFVVVYRVHQASAQSDDDENPAMDGEPPADSGPSDAPAADAPAADAPAADAPDAPAPAADAPQTDAEEPAPTVGNEPEEKESPGNDKGVKSKTNSMPKAMNCIKDGGLCAAGYHCCSEFCNFMYKCEKMPFGFWNYGVYRR